MTRINKSNFVSNLGDRAVAVDVAKADPQLSRADVGSADLNGDGLIQGPREASALFRALDVFDRDGNYDSMRLETGAGQKTRAGAMVDAVERLASDDLPPQSLSRDAFVDSMRGHSLRRSEAEALLGTSLGRVDSNGDGELAGKREADRLFTTIDQGDTDGNSNSVRTAVGADRTPVGSQIDAMLAARRPDETGAWDARPTGYVGSAYEGYQDAIDDGLVMTRGTAGKVVTAMESVRSRWSMVDEVARRADVPPALVAGLWYREDSEMRTDRYLHNGQPLGRTTTIVPRGIYFGRDQFVEAAVHALNMKRDTRDALNLSYESRDLAAMAAFSERYNGFGYRRGGRASPYVTAGTDLYRGGLYVRDGAFDPRVVDRRIGTLPLMRAVLDEMEP